MASKVEWESMRLALGDRLMKDPRVTAHLYPNDTGNWADFDAIWHENEYHPFSSGEMQQVALAEVLYRGFSKRFDLGVLMSLVDEDGWKRAIEAITTRRGIHDGLSILPGQWIESFGA